MIEPTEAIKVFRENLERTNMLIEVMKRNAVYNSLYQQDTYNKNRELGDIVKKSQDEQARKIENSCAEHAIISLSTLFETYCKELVQELLGKFPEYFQNKQTKFQAEINNLITSRSKNNYEDISLKLRLRYRSDFIKFFKCYEIAFLTTKEVNLIEYIYLLRNCFVHNAGKMDKKTLSKLNKMVSPVKETYKTTMAKELRTQIKRTIPKLHQRIICQFPANL